MNKHQCLILAVLVILLLFPLTAYNALQGNQLQGSKNTPSFRFSDVPAGHYSDSAISELNSKKIIAGIKNNIFGFGINIKKGDFITYLVRLMGWKLVRPDTGSFTDNMNRNGKYYAFIETAVENGAILKDTGTYNPDRYMTRSEAAAAIVRGMGYDTLAKLIGSYNSSFKDIGSSQGHITLASDMGLIFGVTGDRFAPDGFIKREDAAVILMRVYEKLHRPIEELHAFYAIKSYPQITYIKNLNSVSFGWSRMEYDSASGRIVLNTTQSGNNDFYIPQAFTEPVNLAKQQNIPVSLNVFASQSLRIRDEKRKVDVGLVEYIIKDPAMRKQAVDLITAQVCLTRKGDEEISFDGVVIDFECLKGNELKKCFNLFLQELSARLRKEHKYLYVAVHPVRSNGQEYFDGYDFRTIGAIADRVILMAHDYNTTHLTDKEMESNYNDTPLTPIDEVYYALKAATDAKTGVPSLKKLWLQISFNAIQWSAKDGKIVKPDAQSVGFEFIRKLMEKETKMENVVSNYSKTLDNPWITYYNNTDNTSNIIWYEDSRSVIAKIELAKMFGIQGISLWRLGNIPDYAGTGSSSTYLDIWQQVLKKLEAR